MISKRDYEGIANVFRAQLDDVDTFVLSQGDRLRAKWTLLDTAKRLARMMRANDPRFDYDRFLAATGVELAEADEIARRA